MNVALVFAGGTGQRMQTKNLPKQFLKLHGKPIIIYTLEQFENHPDIDAIVLVCIESWHDYMKKLLKTFGITKVVEVLSGGVSGQDSIFNGVKRAHELYGDDAILLIHDGVRPLIDQETITENLICVKENGSAITVSLRLKQLQLLAKNKAL